MLSFTLLIKENSLKIEREVKPMILDISQENKYTETEKEVIDYLMNHLDLLEELSINDLAKKLILLMRLLLDYAVKQVIVDIRL